MSAPKIAIAIAAAGLVGWFVWRKFLGGDTAAAKARLASWVKGTEAGAGATYVVEEPSRGTVIT